MVTRGGGRGQKSGEGEISDVIYGQPLSREPSGGSALLHCTPHALQKSLYRVYTPAIINVFIRKSLLVTPAILLTIYSQFPRITSIF